MVEIFNYNFKDAGLFERAIAHSSLGKDNYELLEFLGDKVIALILTEYLFNKFPKKFEGDVAKKHAYLASGTVLSEIAISHNLSEIINVSYGERKESGHLNPKNLEDCLESLIGAIYKDSDLETTRSIVLKLWEKYLQQIETYVPVDAKSKLQEMLQKRRIELPKYTIIDQTGLDHKPIFTVELKVKGYKRITAEAPSKKEAEKDIAKQMIAILEQNDK